eukprot:12276403-Alexandrium_andersonii.AAC.1
MVHSCAQATTLEIQHPQMHRAEAADPLAKRECPIPLLMRCLHGRRVAHETKRICLSNAVPTAA